MAQLGCKNLDSEVLTHRPIKVMRQEMFQRVQEVRTQHGTAFWQIRIKIDILTSLRCFQRGTIMYFKNSGVKAGASLLSCYSSARERLRRSIAALFCSILFPVPRHQGRNSNLFCRTSNAHAQPTRQPASQGPEKGSVESSRPTRGRSRNGETQTQTKPTSR